ncbi:MAG TPA: sigma-70 family RNA polymerase sigma factor [Pseudonocardia sp.]
MDEPAEDVLAQRFEAHRPHLRAVAYRMLGSFAEADDAVQEAWLRLNRTAADPAADAVDNLGGWLTTVVARIALDVLRSRSSRREEPLDRLPDPVVTAVDADPERSAVLADSVSLALLIVLQTLTPAERLVFVLHDLFAVPFEEIARIVDRSPAAARQLASRARRRVRGRAPGPDADLPRQQEVVAAFLAASRGGDLDALLAVLDPDITLRVDQGAGVRVVHGAATVAGQALTYARLAPAGRPAVVNGGAGVVTVVDGRVVSVLATTVREGRIVAIDILADRDRLALFTPPA